MQTVSCHRIEDRNTTTTTTSSTICSRSGAQNTSEGLSTCDTSRKSNVTLTDSGRRDRNRYRENLLRSRPRVRSGGASTFSSISEERTSDSESNAQLMDTRDSTPLQQSDDIILNVSNYRNNPGVSVTQTTSTSTLSSNNTDQTALQDSATSTDSNSYRIGTSSQLYRDTPTASSGEPGRYSPSSFFESNSYNDDNVGPLYRRSSNGHDRGGVRQRRRRGGNGTGRRSPRVWTTLNNFDRPFRSEIWNVDLGQGGAEVFASQVTITSASSQSMGDFTLSSRSAIPVYSFISYPSESRFTSSISGVEPDAHAIATATARTPRHVHTAVVIAGGNENESDTALRTAINRAIAGAFAGNGEGAVAANIVNTTYRLQLWDLNDDVVADLGECTF